MLKPRNSFLRNSYLMFFATLLMIVGTAWAAEFHCDVCGMKIPDKARNHVLLKNDAGNESAHLCSVGCIKKAMKGNPKLSVMEFADFNRPDQLINSSKAFFIVGSKKIKDDLGDMAMPPFVGAFATKPEAEAAASKYGDGAVTQSIVQVLK